VALTENPVNSVAPRYGYRMGKESGVTRQSGRLTDHVALGVLSSVIHRDIIDDVIRESGKREARSRLLPAHVVVYYEGYSRGN
jgi:hypothetical protein